MIPSFIFGTLFHNSIFNAIIIRLVDSCQFKWGSQITKKDPPKSESFFMAPAAGLEPAT